jgi:sRNA-binding regulator protein Hfq
MDKYDTLILSNFIIRSNATKSTPFTPYFDEYLMEDSVLGILKGALKINNIPFLDLTKTGINYRDTIKNKTYITLNNIEFEKLPKPIDEKKFQLFPIIVFTNEVHFGGYMTSNAVAGDGGFKHFTQFYLMLVIMNKEEIVYKSLFRYVSPSKTVNSFDEGFQTPSGVSIKQEHWDELVRRNMRGYFKQVGRNKGE